MYLNNILVIHTVIILVSVSAVSILFTQCEAEIELPTVKINIDPFSTIYEGDVINCTIIGDPTVKYWQINNGSHHTTFFGNDPTIFDPELTALDEEYVTLTVYAENSAGNNTDSVKTKIKQIFFGDIHWHSIRSDGDFPLDTMYKNAIKDNYLDFVSCSDHGEWIDRLSIGHMKVRWQNLFFMLKYGKNDWEMIKKKAQEYYDEGNFTTFLGFEWSASSGYLKGGRPWSEHGWEDVSHINFYYKDIYPNAGKYSAWETYTYDDIFKAMAKEWDKGHLNIGFPHHPQAKPHWFKIRLRKFGAICFTVNWSFLANKMKNTYERDKIFRGVEVYSRWGNAIGKFSNIPIPWSYPTIRLYDQTDAWVENGMWEWSENLKGRKYVMQASSDTHVVDRPGSAKEGQLGPHPSGIMAAYSVHNTRDEIWDAMNDCEIYATQLLKIRANVRFDGQFAYGSWINCSSPLNIRITAQSTFPGNDNGNRNMCPHGYSSDELNYPIQDIWLIKKDRDRGRPWCKVINHTTPNSNLVVVNFKDYDVQPNDFYYVAIRQKGQELVKGENEYMAYIGPVFINQVY